MDCRSVVTSWLFDEAAKGSQPTETRAVTPPSPGGREREREEVAPQEPQAIPTHPSAARRPPTGPCQGHQLIQQAIHAVIPGQGSGQKRTLSMRSPSPSNHPNKTRRVGPDVPTGPRSMRDDRGPRSLVDRLGPVPQHEAGPNVGGNMGMGPMGVHMQIPDAELRGIPPNMLPMLRQEAGIPPDKDPNLFTPEEKVACRQALATHATAR